MKSLFGELVSVFALWWDMGSIFIHSACVCVCFFLRLVLVPYRDFMWSVPCWNAVIAMKVAIRRVAIARLELREPKY